MAYGSLFWNTMYICQSCSEKALNNVRDSSCVHLAARFLPLVSGDILVVFRIAVITTAMHRMSESGVPIAYAKARK